MRMSEEEAERLDLVAKHYGLTAASLFRHLLRKEEVAIKTPLPQGAVMRVVRGGFDVLFPAEDAPKRKAKKARR
jgi:predicted DNA-binding protein